MIVFKSDGDIEQVLAYDAFLEAAKDHWLAREIRSYWKRVLKRVDVTSRSLVAVIEPGSCFAGTLAEIALRLRPLLHADRATERQQSPPAAIALNAMNFGAYPMPNGISRLESRFLHDAGALESRAGKNRRDARRRSRRRARPRHLRL